MAMIDKTTEEMIALADEIKANNLRLESMLLSSGGAPSPSGTACKAPYCKCEGYSKGKGDGYCGRADCRHAAWEHI